MNAKDYMIEVVSEEPFWFSIAKRIVRMDLARKAQQKEQDHEGIHRIQILKT